MNYLKDLRRSGKWILAAILAFFTLHNGGIVEGYLFPVVSVAEIQSSKDDNNDGWAEVSGEFDKLRDCRFEAIEWYWLSEKSASRVAINFNNVTTRGKAHQIFEGWTVQMPFDQVYDRSMVKVYHQCHPLWKTQTRFYP